LLHRKKKGMYANISVCLIFISWGYSSPPEIGVQ
jgi:hypothetical protein